MVNDDDFVKSLDQGAVDPLALHVRMGSYQNLIRPTLERYAADANPAIRRLGARLAWCLECPGDCPCDGCPYLGLS